jgi:hypothetical protein
MDVNRAPNEPFYDLSVQPFRLLRVDPTVAKAQIDDAFDVAQRNGTASFAAIISAREALLNPERRLSCELAYPVDCPLLCRARREPLDRSASSFLGSTLAAWASEIS